MTKYSHQCNFSLFWYTSLACSPEKQAIQAIKNTDRTTACEILIPLYDQVLDLKALTAKIGYLVHSGNM